MPIRFGTDFCIDGAFRIAQPILPTESRSAGETRCLPVPAAGCAALHPPYKSPVAAAAGAGQRGVNELAAQIAVVQPLIRRLQHQDDGHLLLRVDPEISAGDAAPEKFAD